MNALDVLLLSQPLRFSFDQSIESNNLYYYIYGRPICQYTHSINPYLTGGAGERATCHSTTIKTKKIAECVHELGSSDQSLQIQNYLQCTPVPQALPWRSSSPSSSVDSWAGGPPFQRCLDDLCRQVNMHTLGINMRVNRCISRRVTYCEPFALLSSSMFFTARAHTPIICFGIGRLTHTVPTRRLDVQLLSFRPKRGVSGT